MSVYFAIPSARPPAEAEPHLRLWRERGYYIALLRQGEPISCDLLEMTPTYLGWAASVNFLVKRILAEDTEAEWIVTGGDDYEPHVGKTAGQIAFECGRHFGESQQVYRMEPTISNIEKAPQQGRFHWSTFGVMQPTGDRWGDDGVGGYPKGSAYIDRICGSPWMGREFCERMYSGTGPLYAGYHHMFADEELQNVAIKLGVLWQRRDLTQKHCHWGRRPDAQMKDCPDFLLPVNSPKHWSESKALFGARKAAGFAGHEPLDIAAKV